jgi:hypothetical protein
MTFVVILDLRCEKTGPVPIVEQQTLWSNSGTVVQVAYPGRKKRE